MEAKSDDKWYLFRLGTSEKRCSPSSVAALFADDTKVFYPLTNIHLHIQLQNNIYILIDWGNKSGMEFKINYFLCAMLPAISKNNNLFHQITLLLIPNSEF